MMMREKLTAVEFTPASHILLLSSVNLNNKGDQRIGIAQV